MPNKPFSIWSRQSAFGFKLLLCIFVFGNIISFDESQRWSEMVETNCWGGSENFYFRIDLILLEPRGLGGSDDFEGK